MRQRILDRLDDRLVEFRFFPFHLDAHFLPARHGHVAHRARKFAPDISDGLHARLHHAFLQFRGDQVQSLAGGQQPAVFRVVAELQDLVAQQHQFADPVHQPVQLAHFHADGAVAGAAGARLLLQVQRFHKFLRFNGALFHQNLSDAPRIALLLLLHRVVNVDNLRRSPLDQDFPDVRFRLHFRALRRFFRFRAEALLL